MKFSSLSEKAKEIRVEESLSGIEVALSKRYDGKQLKDVQEWLGHANISMTTDVYGHLDLSRKREIGSTMSNLVKI